MGSECENARTPENTGWEAVFQKLMRNRWRDSHCFPLIALVLGYPTVEPAHQMGRLEGAGVIHYEKYHRLTKDELEEITRKCDDPQLHLSLNDNWKTEGYKHYLDWSFKSWSGNSSKPTDRETQMLRLLKRSGFVDMQKA
jgi:hypothetical protein